MTVVVTHSTPSDSSFSATGAAAWDASHSLTGVGTLAEQNANAVAITGGSIDGTTIGFTTASTGKFSDLTNSSLTVDRVPYAGFGGYLLDSANLTFDGTRLVTNTLASTGTASFGISSTAYWSALGGSAPNLRSTAGGTIDIGGANNLSIRTNTTAEQFRVSHTASAVNYVQVTGGATTKSPIFSVAGSDTNISQVFQSKGTGAIDLAAGSSGVNISNGGTVTALTRTAAGSAYTSIPGVVISAPTTAGGVQATATATMLVSTAVISAGGSGYLVGDVLTLSGGTFSTVATVTVATLSGSAVATVTITGSGTYSALPTNPVSVTGGTGAGATFNLTWAVQTTFTITNAGSGYVEQPTVTFSSGTAAAYATVGAGTIVKSIGSTMSFYTPSGEQFRVRDNTTTSVNYGTIKGSASGSTVDFGVDGTDAGITLALKSKGTGGIVLYTAAGNNAQLSVSHTASAVNYVQVTGAATGNQPVISAQGSDANVTLNIASKGNAFILFNANSAEQFRTGSVASAVNSLQFNGATTGNSPSISSRGTNTDIDLTLTPKGTGVVQFGTYTASILTPTGYITIKDSGGTTRRVLIG